MPYPKKRKRATQEEAQAVHKRQALDHKQAAASQEPDMLRNGIRAVRNTVDLGLSSLRTNPARSYANGRARKQASDGAKSSIRDATRGPSFRHRDQSNSGKSKGGPYGKTVRHDRRQDLQAAPIHHEEYICNNYELPRAAQYGLEKEPVDDPSSIIINANLDGIVQSHHESARITSHVHRLDHKMELGDECLLLVSRGHGRTKAEAERNAHLHAVCQLHQKGLLQEILPGGKFILAARSDTHSINVAAQRDVIDYAARHDCLPVFELHSGRSKLKKRLVTARVSISEMGLVGLGRHTKGLQALTQACLSLKAAAETRHEKSGDGLLLVKDYTKLTTASSRQFLDYYCFTNKTHYETTTDTTRQTQSEQEWVTQVTLPAAVIAPETRPSGEVQEAAEPGELPSTITFTGIPMKIKKDSEDVGLLAAALALKKQDPVSWKQFVREMKRGNGEVLKPVRPIDVHMNYETIEDMRQTVSKVQKANEQSTFDLLELERKASVRRSTNNTSRQLSDAEIAEKNQNLKDMLVQYENNPTTQDLRKKRSELPMVQHKEDLLQIVNANEVCVVVGATGSGKTTQLPQLILEELTRSGNGGTCNIICTQPRRIAAISVAQRVAVERNEILQQSVGYAVRFDSKLPKFGGSINYCTTGILLRQMQEHQESVLDGISHIIVDEVHERDIQIDFLLVILKQMLADRKAAGRKPIKIILMSATIDTTLFCKYFGSGFESGRCPYITIPGRTFPVTSHHLDEIHATLIEAYPRKDAPELYSRDTSTYVSRELASNLALTAPPTENNSENEDGTDKAIINWSSKGVVGEDGELDLAPEKEDTVTPVGLMSVTIAHILKTTTEGSILVFLPGLQEITALNRLLTTSRPLNLDISNDPNYKLYMLHSAIPQMQQEVFEKLEEGKRKIILSTNIAETSITIPDVVYVVDSGKVRESQYDQAKRISSLVSTWTSKSSAKQRAGRAGRVQHGHYYSMASDARYESFEVTAQPEILRTDLQELCLQIKSMNIQDIQKFLAQAVQPPPTSSIENSIDHLQELRALNEQENLTPLGRLLSTLPVQPSLGKMVLLATIFKCLDPILILAAACTGKDPFLNPPDRRQEADRVKRSWADGSGSDHVAVIRAFQAWRALRASPGSDDRRFAFDNFLHYNTLVSIAQTGDQIMELMQKAGAVKQETGRKNTRFRTVYGSEDENINSGSRALQAALLTAGFFPNVAVQTFSSRALRTAHENAAQIHINSLAAPRSSGPSRYGPISREDQVPQGTLFTFGQKTQADQTTVMLRSVSRISPLAVVFFGGSSKAEGSILKVDDWIPFYMRTPQMKATLELNDTLEQYLETTFARLGAANQRKLLSQNNPHHTSAENFLDQDPAREPLVSGMVRALEKTSGTGYSSSTSAQQRAAQARSFTHERRGPRVPGGHGPRSTGATRDRDAALTQRFEALFAKSSASNDEARLFP